MLGLKGMFCTLAKTVWQTVTRCVRHVISRTRTISTSARRTVGVSAKSAGRPTTRPVPGGAVERPVGACAAWRSCRAGTGCLVQPSDRSHEYCTWCETYVCRSGKSCADCMQKTCDCAVMCPFDDRPRCGKCSSKHVSLCMECEEPVCRCAAFGCRFCQRSVCARDLGVMHPYGHKSRHLFVCDGCHSPRTKLVALMGLLPVDVVKMVEGRLRLNKNASVQPMVTKSGNKNALFVRWTDRTYSYGSSAALWRRNNGGTRIRSASATGTGSGDTTGFVGCTWSQTSTS